MHNVNHSFEGLELKKQKTLAEPSGKRKDITEETDLLVEKIKRCKINFSPGELRYINKNIYCKTKSL